MPKKPESKLQEQCLKYIKELEKQGQPIIAINQHGSAFSSRGVPDILMCVKGIFIAVELKIAPNKPTPLQEHYIERIRNAKGLALVIYEYEDFKSLVNYALY